MLENLDKVEWSILTHAYGTAEDVPKQISDLAALDDKTRKAGYSALYCTICHQGSRYQASALTVSFLFELLNDQNVPDRAQVIYLLVHLAVGCPDYYVPSGFDPDREFPNVSNLRSIEREANAAYKKLCAASEDARIELTADESDLANRVYELWACDAYKAVERKASMFHRLTDDSQSEVRIAALYAISFFPMCAEESTRVSLRVIHSPDTSPLIRGHALLTLGITDTYLKTQRNMPLFESYLQGTDALVRMCASLAMLTRSIQSGSLSFRRESIGNNNGRDSESWNLPEKEPAPLVVRQTAGLFCGSITHAKAKERHTHCSNALGRNKSNSTKSFFAVSQRVAELYLSCPA